MIQIKLLLRLLAKDYKTTIVKLCSLVVGLTISLVTFLQIAHELNYDDFHPDKERMFRIGSLWNNKGKLDDGHMVIAPLAAALRDNLPEVEEYALIRRNWSSFYTKERDELSCKSIYADSTFFSFFHFPIISRKSKCELNRAFTVFVSRRAAKQFFGREDVLGEMIYDANQISYEIEGIFEDVPANSHLDYDIVISFETIRKKKMYYAGWGGGNSFTGYLKLASNVDPKIVEEQIDGVVAKYYDNKDDLKSGISQRYYLQAIEDLNVKYNDYTRVMIKILGTIGVIILLVAILNYVLLALTTFYKQFHSLGIQQYTGASNGKIRKIIVLEHLLVIGLATLISILIIKPIMSITTAHLAWSEEVLFNNYSLYFILGVIALVLLLSIGLPLIKLRRIKYRVLKELKERSRLESGAKRFLLSFQMVGATVMMIILFMLFRQLSYIEDMKLGYETNNRAYILIKGKANRSNSELLMAEISKLSFVEGVAKSRELLVYGLGGNGFSVPENREKYWISRVMSVSNDFHSVMEMGLLDGQYFSAYPADASNLVIVNKRLVDMMSWKVPIGKTILRNNKSYQVVGVVDDFVQNVYMAKQPIIFYKIPPRAVNSDDGYISVKLNSHTTAKQIDQLRALLLEQSKVVNLKLVFYDDKIADFYSTEKRLKSSLIIFSIIAMLLAVIGLGGFVLNEVEQRTKEIGVRKVNGAKISEILLMFNKEFIRWLVVSFVVACPLAYFLIQQLMVNYKYKADAVWWIFAIPCLFAFTIAMITVSLHALNQARRNPVEALRYE